MRVVLDTNVLVSALIKPAGTAGAVVYEVVSNEEHMLLLTTSIVEELNDTLCKPKFHKYKNINAEKIEDWITDLITVSHFIEPQFSYSPIVFADPTDDCFIIAAIEGKADCIVTGDKHLLAFYSYQGIPILTPAHCLNALKHGTYTDKVLRFNQA
jgi:putative PIN family toxin of toxin-antitoxin system